MLHNAPQTRAGGAGVDADLVVFVTALDPGACDFLAQASACAFDAATSRSVAGEIQFCNIGRQSPDVELATAVHELVHVLVRSLAPCAMLLAHG